MKLVFTSQINQEIIRPSEKLVAVTPKNKDKKVRFADPVTSSSNTQKQVDSHKPKDSNQPLLHSTGVIGSTSARGSKPTDNTKNNRISYSSSSKKTNKVEDQSRSVKSRKYKKNCVAKSECNAYVMKSILNANSKYVCTICNECLFNVNHDKCVLDYVYDMNVLSKSKPAKRKNKKQIWKPTGKVYTEIGYKWKPTGRTFTIVGNKCPLTRFTSTKVVPLKETTTKSVLTPTQGIMVYSRKPKATKSVGSSKKSKIIESRISNQSKPTQTGKSTISNVPSSSLIKVYYVEGLGQNLFFVGQFGDSDLEVAFRKHTCFVRNLEGVDLLTRSRGTNLYTMSIGDMIKYSPICLLSKASKTKNIHIDNGTKFVNQTLRSYYEDVEAVATTCYTQNRSLIRLRYEKTPYELLHDRKPDLSYLHVFGALCYLTNNSKDLGKLKAKADDTLLQPLFDEYFHPPPCVDHPILKVAALEPAVLTGTPSSTLVDQDAPSPSTSQTPQESPSHVISPSAEEADHDIEVADMDNHPYFGIPIPEPSSEESSSQVVIPNNVHSVNQPPEHISK
ncbi:retrovirus-related pol polyprotein from transposon TNT 1-94 [Tanacetum coccineum]